MATRVSKQEMLKRIDFTMDRASKDEMVFRFKLLHTKLTSAMLSLKMMIRLYVVEGNKCKARLEGLSNYFLLQFGISWSVDKAVLEVHVGMKVVMEF